MQAAVSQVKVVTFETDPKCAQALRQGQIDVMAQDVTALLSYVGQTPDKLQIVPSTVVVGDLGIAVKKGDVALCNFIDDTLKKASSDGTYASLWDKNLGTMYKAAGINQDAPTLPAFIPCA